MNYFHADNLLRDYDSEDVLPFSKRLDDQIRVSEILNAAKAASSFSDASLKSYIVCLDSRTRISSGVLKAIAKPALTDAVIQLQKVLATVIDSPLQEVNIHLLRQLFFIVCARLMLCSNGRNYDGLVAILYLFSMESWACARKQIQDDACNSWAALLALESVLVVRCYDSMELDRMLCDDELSARLVRALIPEDSSIMSLHSKNFDEAKMNCKTLNRTWEDRNTIDLAKRIVPYASSQLAYSLFVELVLNDQVDPPKINSDLLLRTIFSTLSNGTEEMEDALNLDDIKVFLVTSGIWSRMSSQGLYNFTSEQCYMWKSFVGVAQGEKDLAQILLVRKECNNLRNPTTYLSSKFLYSVFEVLERARFPQSFCGGYASRIRSLIEGGTVATSVSSGRLFPLRSRSEDMYPTVEEEEEMLTYVTRFLANSHLGSDEFDQSELDQGASTDNSFVSANESHSEYCDGGKTPTKDHSRMSDHSLPVESDESSVYDEYLCELLRVKLDRMKAFRLPCAIQESVKEDSSPLYRLMKLDLDDAHAKIRKLECDLKRQY